MQYFQRSIGSPNITAAPQALPGGGASSVPPLHLQIGGEEGEIDTTDTPTFKTDGTQGDSLEKLIITKSAEALNQVIKEYQFDLWTGEEEVTVYASVPVNLELPNQLVAKVGGVYILISKISFELGVKIVQTRFKLDRQAQYEFALAVENKVSGKVTAAARKKNAETTNLSPHIKKEVPPGEKPVENGATLKFGLKAFFPFEELLGGKKMERIYVVKPRDESAAATVNTEPHRK
jgi:hypothetical protein